MRRRRPQPHLDPAHLLGERALEGKCLALTNGGVHLVHFVFEALLCCSKGLGVGGRGVGALCCIGGDKAGDGVGGGGL